MNVTRMRMRMLFTPNRRDRSAVFFKFEFGASEQSFNEIILKYKNLSSIFLFLNNKIQILIFLVYFNVLNKTL